MPVVELDLLLAFLASEDRHHKVASNYFSRVTSGSLTKPTISPFALQELELGVRAGRILPYGKPARGDIDSARRFFGEVCEALEIHDIRVQPLSCVGFKTAAEFRHKYGLTYYDSLHASSAFSNDKIIVSTDKDYDRVKEIRREDPYKL
jgi:predicted nucleic acid-binding protein